MLNITDINTVVGALQASIAPVTLISGIGFLALVMSGRYGRVIDRIRVLLRQIHVLPNEHEERKTLVDEIRILYRRANLLRISAILAGGSIFCVVLTIFLVFANLIFAMPFNYITEITFILSLILLLAFVIVFIHEFGISLHAVKFEIEHGLKNSGIDPKILHQLPVGDEP